MKREDEPLEGDDALRALLRQAEPPALPDGIDERVLARYRRAYVPWWRRWSLSFRVAVPVALSLVVAAGAAVLVRRPGPAPDPALVPPSTSFASAAAKPTQASLAGFQPMDEVTATVVTESP